MPVLISRRTLRKALAFSLLLCFLLSTSSAFAQNDTMLQAFYWDVPVDDVHRNGDWWNNLAGKARQFRDAGITGVWTPPPSKGNFGIYDMGYGIFDHFDLGNYNQKGTTETRFGSRAELQAMLNAMHTEGIEVYADIVMNHLFTDYHELEVNPAVKAYVDGEAHAGANTAYPTGEIVWRIPNAQPGDYYVQVKGYNLNCDAGAYNDRAYELYATWTNPNPAFPYDPYFPPPYPFETEPNGGFGNGGADDFPGSGQRIWAHVNQCGDIDEYKITVTEAHDINLILTSEYGGDDHLVGSDQRKGFRIFHVYYNGNDLAGTQLQALTYTGINYLANYNVNHTGAGEQNWAWNYTYFHPVDAADYLQSDEGSNDAVIPNAKIFGIDLNTFDTRADGVQNRLKYWGQWLADVVGFDGYRLDFVRGYQESFAADWIKAMPKKTGGAQRFVVGEYFSGNKSRLKSWVNTLAAQGADADVFDFNLKYTLNGLANGNSSSFNMTTLNHAGMVRDDTGNSLSGLDVVTFVENHDTGKDSNQWIFKDWQLPYAYILFSEGRPCLFYPHLYNVTQRSEQGFTTAAPLSLQTDIKNLINIRRTYLDGASVVLSETGNPFPASDTANAYVARRQGNSAAGKPGAILVLNNHETATKCLYVDNAPAGSGYPNWANKMLVDVTGTQAATQVFADGRVQVCAPPRGYSIYLPDENTPATASLSGLVTDIRTGNGIGGVTVTLSGSQSATTTTDSNGNFSFSNLPTNGSYTVSVAKTNYTFTPATRTFNNLQINQSAADFTGALGHKASDFDGDGRADVAVWNPADGNWYFINSSNGVTSPPHAWGLGSLGDVPVPGDYDGDGRTDLAVFRSSEGNWYIINSATNTGTVKGWGQSGDVPVPADYDGDGQTDIAVWRPSESNWYIIRSNNGAPYSTVQIWGTATDKPVLGDFDGDRKADLAVFRPSEGNWYIINSSTNSVTAHNWGLAGDKLVPGDYDGDGRTDLAVWRPSEGNWYIIQSSSGGIVKGWGLSTDVPAPADYDGDGKTDIAIFRPSEGNWYIINSATNTMTLLNIGSAGSVPVPNAYLPG